MSRGLPPAPPALRRATRRAALPASLLPLCATLTLILSPPNLIPAAAPRRTPQADAMEEEEAAAPPKKRAKDNRSQNEKLYAEDGMFNPKQARAAKKAAKKGKGKKAQGDGDDSDFDWDVREHTTALVVTAEFPRSHRHGWAELVLYVRCALCRSLTARGVFNCAGRDAIRAAGRSGEEAGGKETSEGRRGGRRRRWRRRDGG